MTLPTMLIAPGCGKPDRFGRGWLIATGLTLLSIQLFYYSTAGTSARFWDLLPGLLVGGVGWRWR